MLSVVIGMQISFALVVAVAKGGNRCRNRSLDFPPVTFRANGEEDSPLFSSVSNEDGEEICRPARYTSLNREDAEQACPKTTSISKFIVTATPTMRCRILTRVRTECVTRNQRCRTTSLSWGDRTADTTISARHSCCRRSVLYPLHLWIHPFALTPSVQIRNTSGAHAAISTSKLRNCRVPNSDTF